MNIINKVTARRHFEEIWNKGSQALEDKNPPDFVSHDPNNSEVRDLQGLNPLGIMQRTSGL